MKPEDIHMAIMGAYGEAIPSQCDPYSLYVQLSICLSLDGIMLLSRVRKRDVAGNNVPGNMVAAEERLEMPSSKRSRKQLQFLEDGRYKLVGG
jgi:hypothetical protein